MDLAAEGIEEHAGGVLTAGATIRIDYVNWRGERAWREIVPQRLYLAELEWHPGRQWILDAWDVGKQAVRSFAMKDIRAWMPAETKPSD